MTKTLSPQLRAKLDEITARAKAQKSALAKSAPSLPMTYDKRGNAHATPSNFRAALQRLGVSLRHDMFSGRDLIERDERVEVVEDHHVIRLRLEVDEQHGCLMPSGDVHQIVTDLARQNSYHPVREYLDGLSPWDGVPRIDRWLIDAGAEDTPYVRAVSRIVLVAAVRRIREPGCKFDEMLILESDQGTEKSSALATLAVCDDWYTDDLPLGADTRKMIEATSGKWIVEAGELVGLRKAEVGALKSYLSRRIDHARMAYGRRELISPRQFIVIGTTNEQADYLRDATGNRRFWPVRVQRFDLDRLRAERDQIWAEASHAEASGESIRLAPELWGAAASEQERRRTIDPFEEWLAILADVTGKIRTVDVYKLALGDERRPTQDESRRIGAAMRRMGWTRPENRKRHGGEHHYVFWRGDDEQRARAITLSGNSVTGWTLS